MLLEIHNDIFIFYKNIYIAKNISRYDQKNYNNYK